MQSYFISGETTPVETTGSTLPFCHAKYLPEYDPPVHFSRCFIVLVPTCTCLETGYNVALWLHISLYTHLSDDQPRARCAVFCMAVTQKAELYSRIPIWLLFAKANQPTYCASGASFSYAINRGHFTWFIFLAQETGLNNFLNVTVI